MLKDSATRHEELLRLLASQPSPSILAKQIPQAHHVHKDHHYTEDINFVKLEPKENKERGILPMPVKEVDSGKELTRDGNKQKCSPSTYPIPKA